MATSRPGSRDRRSSTRYGSIILPPPRLPCSRPAPRAPRRPGARRRSSARAAPRPAPASGRRARGRRGAARARRQPPAIWSGLSSDPLLAGDPAEHAVHQPSGLWRCIPLCERHRLVDGDRRGHLALGELPHGEPQDVAFQHGHTFGGPALGRGVDAAVEALAVGPRPLRLGAHELGHTLTVVPFVGVVERAELAAGQILLVEEECGAAPLLAPAWAHRSPPSWRATSVTVTSTARTSRPVIRCTWSATASRTATASSGSTRP